jgi:hypothetical protein
MSWRRLGGRPSGRQGAELTEDERLALRYVRAVGKMQG